MIKNVENEYKNVRVILDNNEFIKCRFEGCVLEFSGLGPVSLVECGFSNVSWVFSGPAQNTLQFLKGVYHGMGEGGRSLVETTFENLRQPPK